MNLDEYIAILKVDSTEIAAFKLATLLTDWKQDSTDVNDLVRLVERYFGNIWISSTKRHNDLNQNWIDFKQDAIDSIAGQTMNERLYWFGLQDGFDNATSPEDRDQIYAKLLASA